MKEEGKPRRGHLFIPTTIDFKGGCLMTEGQGEDQRTAFRMQGEWGLSLTREVVGDNWRLSCGEGIGKIDFSAMEDSLLVSHVMPMMGLEYTRASGTLVDIFISGVDLAVLAATKMALASGDWGHIEDMKQCGEDRFFKLSFSKDGLEVVCVDSVGREVARVKAQSQESLGIDTIGFIPGQPNYSWKDDLYFLNGKVGFDVFPEKVILFYEKAGELGELVRRNVMEIPRTVLGVAKLDRLVTQGIPCEDDLLEFMEEVYIPLI